MSTILPASPSATVSNAKFESSDNQSKTTGNSSFDSVLKQAYPLETIDFNAPTETDQATETKTEDKPDKEQDKTSDDPQAQQSPDLLATILSTLITANDKSNPKPVDELLQTLTSNIASQGTALTNNINIQSEPNINTLDTEENQVEMPVNMPQSSQFSNSLPETPALNTTPTYQVTPSLNQSGWDQAISQRVVWMANQQMKSATLNINPEHLGPIQIQVQIDNHQQANVQFIATNPEVRQALQNAIPILSNMLEQSGIQLGHSDVSSQNPGSGNPQYRSNASENDNITPEKETLKITATSSGQGLINIYA
jgi:flagellar hook-length control protein FliK